MDQAMTGWTERTVRIETLHGSVEGKRSHILAVQPLDEEAPELAAVSESSEMDG